MTLLSIFLSIFLTLIYIFTFYLSSATPVSETGGLELIFILADTVSLSAIITIAAIPVVFLVNLLLSLFNIKKNLVSKFFTFLILFFGLLLFVENWAYTMFGSSLKTNDTTTMKLLFISVSIFLSYSFSGFIVCSAKRISQISILLTPILLIVGAIPVFLAVSESFRTSNSFNDLEKSIETNQLYNIIIITGDGINAKDMGIYGSERNTTPFLKSKISEFAVFEHAFSNNKQTTGSNVSMLTGMSPITTQVVYPPDILKGHLSVKSLPNILGSKGYYRSNWAIPHFSDAGAQNMQNAFDIDNGKQTTFFHRIPNYLNLTGERRWFFINSISDLVNVALDVFFVKEMQNPFAQVDVELTEQKQKSIKFNDDHRLEMSLKDISNHTEVPFFVHVHFMGTHGPKFHAKNRVYSKSLEQSISWHTDFYHDAILEFDKRVEKIYQLLDTSNTLENTLIVITSDHGLKWNNTLRVPLIIRFPKQKNSGRYDVNVQRLDIAPTILSAIGLETPLWMEGLDLSKPNVIPKDRIIISAGILGPTEKSKEKGRVRKNQQYKDFKSTNSFYFIRCNQLIHTKYPIRFSKLVGIDGNECGANTVGTFILDSTKLLEDRLSQSQLKPGVKPSADSIEYVKKVGGDVASSTKTTEGVINANPYLIQVCDGTGLGQTTISWNAKGFSSTEVHIDSPAGPRMVSGEIGSHVTGKWVKDGMNFFLVDASSGKVLGKVVVEVTDKGCA